MDFFDLHLETNIQLKITVLHNSSDCEDLGRVSVQSHELVENATAEKVRAYIGNLYTFSARGYRLCLSCSSLGVLQIYLEYIPEFTILWNYKISISSGAGTHSKHLRGSICDIAQEYSKLAS